MQGEGRTMQHRRMELGIEVVSTKAGKRKAINPTYVFSREYKEEQKRLFFLQGLQEREEGFFPRLIGASENNFVN